MRAWLARQSFLGENSDAVLATSRIAICGLGGGGSHVAQQTAHAGVGTIYAFDPDHVEDTNLNRLVGATARDAKRGTPKVKVARRVIRAVNPDAAVIAVPKKWQERPELLHECDVVFGCVDSFLARRDLEAECRRYRIPYIDIGMDVFSAGDRFIVAGQVALSLPGGPCLQCLGALRAEDLAKEAARYGAAGSRPQVVWSNGVLASLAVGLFIETVTPWFPRPESSGFLLRYEGNRQGVSVDPLVEQFALGCTHFTGENHLGSPLGPPF